jgi:putative transposase
MLVHQAYRFEMDPNNHTRLALASHAGAARFTYNWGLGLVINHLAARRALVVLAIRSGASRVEAEAWADDLLGPLGGTLPALRRAWNQAKAEVAPWWAENSKESYNSGLDALARAVDAWSKSRRGRRKGRAVGFPRFKAKSAARRSFRVTAGAFGVEVTRPEHRPLPPGAAVGVDVGVKSLAVLSTGEVVPNSKHVSCYARRVARLARQCARRAGPAKGPPSKRWQRSKARLARTHSKVVAARSDGLHKLTTRQARTHAVVVVEDLAVAGMTAWSGSRLVVADRWYPSSKTCSRCKAVKAKLSLSERTYRCCHCGLVIDRDLNAAASLASLAETATSTGTASGAGTSTLLRRGSRANAQGEERVMGSPRCSSTNCEDGTGSTPDKTATATRQRVAPKPVICPK